MDRPKSMGPGPMARWLKVLNAFIERDEWGIREFAAAIEQPRSAVHRILHEMADVACSLLAA